MKLGTIVKDFYDLKKKVKLFEPRS